MKIIAIIDPPYGIDVVHKSIGGAKSFGSDGASNIVKANKYSPIIGDETTDTARMVYDIIIALGVTKMVIWGGNYFTDFLPPSKGWIVWDKKERDWDDNFSDFEMAWTSFDVPAKMIRHTWMGMVQKGEREKRVHPTQKPAQMIAKIIEMFSNEEDIVLDLFGGSGSTLIACEQTNRKCYILELQESYCDVILNRWVALTGGDPIREDGMAWSELKQVS